MGVLNMGNLKNILLQCQEAEKVFERYNITNRDRDRNQGWIECCEFFFRNFDLTEKNNTTERK
jgi:hypothetical protein